MDPRDLQAFRLFGGTALAIYINHRESTDFDFFSDHGGSKDRSRVFFVVAKR